MERFREDGMRLFRWFLRTEMMGLAGAAWPLQRQNSITKKSEHRMKILWVAALLLASSILAPAVTLTFAGYLDGTAAP